MCGKLTKPCRHAKTFQLVSQQCLSSINNKNTNILTKRQHNSHHFLHRQPAPLLWHRYTEVYLRIFDTGTSNPTSFLGLCSPGANRQSIESPMGVPTFTTTEKALTFTTYDCILRIRPKKVCYLAKANFHQKLKIMNLLYFWIFMYTSGHLKCLGVFSCEKLTNPYRHARPFQLVCQQSLASINNKISTVLTNRPHVATIVPSGTHPNHWSMGIPGYTFGSLIQARAITPHFWGSALPVTTGSLQQAVPNGRPHLQLYRNGAYIHYL